MQVRAAEATYEFVTGIEEDSSLVPMLAHNQFECYPTSNIFYRVRTQDMEDPYDHNNIVDPPLPTQVSAPHDDRDASEHTSSVSIESMTL